jgi:hypothetical protein
MATENIVPSVQPGVEIMIDNIGGELVVAGRSPAGIRASGDNPRMSLEDDGKRIRISCDGDCTLRVPEDAHFVIDNISGDAKITDVSGNVSINNVGGDLVLRDTGPVHLQHIGGDLELKRIAGKAEVETVGGDAVLRDIEGELHVDTIGGEAAVTNIEENCECDTIGSDFIFNMDFVPGDHYRFNVGGDVIGKVRPDANVRFILPWETGTSIDIVDVQIINDGEHRVITLGSGAATVEFETIGGEFRLVGAGKGDQEPIEGGYEMSFADDIVDIISARVSEQIAPILDRVKRQTERIQQQAERTAERARERSESRPRAWSFGGSSEKTKRGGIPPIPPIPPVPPIPPMGNAWGEKAKRDTGKHEAVTDEERMTILRMVESKQISVEEAERLLAALEESE